MSYLFLVVGIIDLMVVFLYRDWGFAIAILVGFFLLVVSLYEIFFKKK